MIKVTKTLNFQQCTAAIDIKHSTVQFDTIQSSTVQYRKTQYGTKDYGTVHNNTIQYRTIQLKQCRGLEGLEWIPSTGGRELF